MRLWGAAIAMAQFVFPYWDDDAKQLVTDHLAIKNNYITTFGFKVNLLALTPALLSPLAYGGALGFVGLTAMPRQAYLVQVSSWEVTHCMSRGWLRREIGL